MFKMFSQLFSMISSFLTAGEKLGNAAVNLAGVGEEMSGEYADVARIERQIKRNKLMKEFSITEKQLSMDTTLPKAKVQAVTSA